MRCSAGHSTGCDRDVRDHCGAGEPRAARAVGQALGRNPFPIIVSCHRVLTAGWAVFPPTGGVATKLKLLATEGAVLALADPPIARATRHA